jgi:hypothetical protein
MTRASAPRDRGPRLRLRGALPAAVLALGLAAAGAGVARLAAGAAAGDSAQAGGAGPAAVPQGPAPTLTEVRITRIPHRELPGLGTAAVELDLRGSGFFGTAFGPFVRVEGEDVLAVILDAAEPDRRILAYAKSLAPGKHRVEVVNPDGQRAAAIAEL